MVDIVAYGLGLDTKADGSALIRRGSSRVVAPAGDVSGVIIGAPEGRGTKRSRFFFGDQDFRAQARRTSAERQAGNGAGGVAFGGLSR